MAQAAGAESGVVSGLASGCWSCIKAISKLVGKACSCFSACVRKMSTRTVSIVLRVVNLINAAFLAVACYFAYTIALGNATRFFLATYIGIFAILLFAFETRIKYTETAIRKNCGFMYTYTGRAALLIFLGAITFGMIDTSSGGNTGTTGFSVVVGAGCFTLFNSIFNCFVICSHPGFQELSKQAEESFAGGPQAGSDPSKMTEAQIKAYLQQHPEVAAAALASVKNTPGQPADLEAGTGVASWAQEKPSAGVSDWGRSKPKASPTTSGSTAYVPPPVSLSPPSSKPQKDASEANPFATTTTAAAPAASSKAPAVVSPPAPAARAPAPAPVPAPAPAAATHVIAEDNPFATDNPFDT